MEFELKKRFEYRIKRIKCINCSYISEVPRDFIGRITCSGCGRELDIVV